MSSVRSETTAGRLIGIQNLGTVLRLRQIAELPQNVGIGIDSRQTFHVRPFGAEMLQFWQS
jgi:hypothetical protein